jgi:transcriptional regulator with XRE-family HTH domain
MAALALLRAQRLLTQRELAEKAQVTRATVALIEGGKSLASFGTISRMCEALGVKWEEVDEFERSLAAKMIPNPKEGVESDHAE